MKKKRKGKTMSYDKENIFAKILRKEIPCQLVDENENAIAFEDISPRAPIHILIIPKKAYVNFNDFISDADNDEIIDLHKLIKKIINEKKLEYNGYRIIVNNGKDANQEVKHLHFHLLAGKNLGSMLQ